jgi:hypothetical protein
VSELCFPDAVQYERHQARPEAAKLMAELRWSIVAVQVHDDTQARSAWRQQLEIPQPRAGDQKSPRGSLHPGNGGTHVGASVEGENIEGYRHSAPRPHL